MSVETDKIKLWLSQYFARRNGDKSRHWPVGTIWRVRMDKHGHFVVIPDRGLCWVFKLMRGEAQQLYEEAEGTTQ